MSICSRLQIRRAHRVNAIAPTPKLLGRDFLLLFCMSMCVNSYMAVFYCFEQWLDSLSISADWRGALFAALFGMVFLCRPLASILLLSRSKLGPLLCSIIVSSVVMLAYPAVSSENPIAFILILRILQGASLAVFSCCVMAVLVSCIPKGQSARGFAVFSLTMLLPYSLIPTLGERLLPLLGDAPHLFAVTATLGLPALIMLIPLAPRLRVPEMPLTGADGRSGHTLWRTVSHSGLLFVYLACLTFSIVTMQAIAFIKGLCSVTGTSPAMFFAVYTAVIILVRLFGSSRLDALPRYRTTTFCSGLLALALLGLAWGPSWLFVLLAALYGLGLSVLYPVLASAVYERSTPGTRSINANIMLSTFDASGVVGPVIGGMVIHAGYGYRGVFSLMAVIIVVSGGCMLVDKLRLRKRDASAQ